MPRRYPKVTVRQRGRQCVRHHGRRQRGLKEAGVSREEREEFSQRCMFGDYEHLVRVMEWVEVE